MRARTFRLSATAIICMGMITLFSSCPFPGVIFVAFEDPALEAIVKNKLGLRLTPVTSVDMLGLTSLDIEGLDIFSLKGLEYAVAMTFLDASNNPISDIEPLRTCVSLEHLNLEGTQVFEVSALAGLLSLNTVNICEAAVPSIQPLIDNALAGGLGSEDGDTVTVDCELISGPGPDAERATLAATGTFGVGVFLCGDCESSAGTPILAVTTPATLPDEVPFLGQVGTGSNSFTIENSGDGELIWLVDTSTLPGWITSVVPTAGTTTTETDVVTVNVNATGLPGGSDITYALSVVSNGGSESVSIHITTP